MTILSDRSIRYHINTPLSTLVIDPSPEDQAIQPASVDLRLDSNFINPDGSTIESDSVWLHRGNFLLGSTVERVRIPDDMVGRVEGKSSLGRVGVQIHATAGFIDPGFEGNITLEFANLSPNSFELKKGMYICQISFSHLDYPATRPYGTPELGSNYQGQTKTRRSKYESH